LARKIEEMKLVSDNHAGGNELKKTIREMIQLQLP